MYFDTSFKPEIICHEDKTRPTYVTGDVDPSVAFAVAVGIEEAS